MTPLVENLLVLAVVGGALVYLAEMARRGWARLRRLNAGHGCGGGCSSGCDGGGDVRPTPKLVQIESLERFPPPRPRAAQRLKKK